MAASLAITIAALLYGSVVVHKYRRAGDVADMASVDRTYRKEEESDLSDFSRFSRENSSDGRTWA